MLRVRLGTTTVATKDDREVSGTIHDTIDHAPVHLLTDIHFILYLI